MLIGVTGLTLGFVAGGAGLAGVLGIALERSVDAEIDATARQVATLVETDSLPVPVPVAAGYLVQVIDDAGRVRGASADADPLVSMFSVADLEQLRAGQRLTVHGGELGVTSGPMRVAAVNTGPPDDLRTVVVARSMGDVTRGLGLLRIYLLVVIPLLLLGSAVVAWRAIGATLRPVEHLRRGAEEITGSGPRSATRLPVPPGHDEIYRLAVTLNGMLDRLEAGRARQREFVADAAHELRSPLANMRTQLEVARHLGSATDWPAVGEDLLADTNRLARLVDDLLVLARADAGPRPAREEPVDLQALVRDVVHRNASAAVPVRVTEDAPVWTVGNADELRRVVGNLVDNAVRYARTRVDVAVGRDGEGAVLTVTDDGPGIPAEDRERVFERFTRLDDSRTHDTGGAGLGLAIVRELLRRHGGTVALSDAPATLHPPSADASPVEQPPGLAVTVRLPLAPDA
jgi:signal transduction histidine kinase